MKKQGSTLLVILFMLTVITLWATNVWRETAFLIDMSCAKQTYEKQFRLTEALLNYGIAATKILHKRWDHDPSSYQPTQCKFSQWPPQKDKKGSKDKYGGVIDILKKDKEITVFAHLLKGQKKLFSLRSTLSSVDKKEHIKEGYSEPLLIMKDWAIDA